MLLKSRDANNCTHLEIIELLERLNVGRGMSSKPRCIEMSSKSPSDCRYVLKSGVDNEAAVGFRYSFNISEEQTTVTELAHIAAAAIQG